MLLLIGVFFVFSVEETSAQWWRGSTYIIQRPRTPKTLIEMTAEVNFHRLQKEQLEAGRVREAAENDCMAGVRQADQEFNAGRKSPRSGNRCYYERWADFTRPAYRQGPPPGEDFSLSDETSTIMDSGFIRKVLVDHRNKRVDPAFSSWPEEERKKYATIWNQEEKIVAQGDKAGIVLSP